MRWYLLLLLLVLTGCGVSEPMEDASILPVQAVPESEPAPMPEPEAADFVRVQEYLPDLKYALSEPAARYSAAADYPQVARAAILEMYRQTGPFRLDEDGMLQRGVLIRHLILPQQGENTRRVIDWVGQTFAPGQVLFSLMSQYTPVGDLAQWPELQHPISPELNEEMYQYLIDSPITDGFYQDLDAATGDMIPAFDGTGV